MKRFIEIVGSTPTWEAVAILTIVPLVFMAGITYRKIKQSMEEQGLL